MPGRYTCLSFKPGWVGYDSQGRALETAKPGYASRAYVGTCGDFQKYAAVVLWHGLEV